MTIYLASERFPGEFGDCQIRRAALAEIKSLKSQLLPIPAPKKQDRFRLVVEVLEQNIFSIYTKRERENNFRFDFNSDEKVISLSVY